MHTYCLSYRSDLQHCQTCQSLYEFALKHYIRVKTDNNPNNPPCIDLINAKPHFSCLISFAMLPNYQSLSEKKSSLLTNDGAQPIKFIRKR